MGKTDRGGGDDFINDVLKVDENRYWLALASNSPADGKWKTENKRSGMDYWLVCIDSSGNKVWDRTYGGIGGGEDLVA